jgi:hypothetical protein
VYLNLKILFTILVLGLFSNGWAQTFNYSYIDPCTKDIKYITADMSSPIVIAYYGQVQTFNYTQLYDGSFDAWMNNIYNQYKTTSPCQGAVATTTTTNSTNQVSSIISNVTNLINLDFSGIGGASVNVGGTTSAGTNITTNNKKDGNSTDNNSGGDNSSNGSSNSKEEGQTGQNGGNPPENQSGSGSSGNGGVNGNGNNSSSSNNRNSDNQSSENQQATSEQNKAKEDQQSTTNQQTTKSTSKAKTEVQKPAILVTGDIVGIQNKSNGSQDARGTMSFTKVKGDGTASLGLSADYMLNAKIGNVTAIRSWIGVNQKGNKHINVTSGGISFLPKSFTTTAMLVRVNSIKDFTAIYGTAGTYGSLYGEEMISTMMIGGFMYKGNLTKSLYATLIMAGVYTPYQKFYTESLFKSKPVVVPFLNLNYKLTKTFGIGLTAGGTYIAGQDILNYQILMGAKLLL